MKPILLDMNMSVEWIDFLQTQGHTALRWSSVGDPRAEDDVIMEWARANQFIVITQDLDFGTLLALTKARGPSVVQMRGSQVMPHTSGMLLLDALKQYEQALEEGVLLVIDEYRTRVRKLPLF